MNNPVPQHVICVMGYSESGKDTVAAMLAKTVSVQNVKFSLPFKRVMCFYYDITLEQIADKSFRRQEVPDLPGVTWDELMVRFWANMPKIDPLMQIRKTMSEAEKWVKSGYSLVFTDIRNYEEVTAVQSLCERLGLPLVVYRVSSPFEVIKASDTRMVNYWGSLKSGAIYSAHIQNNGSKEDLKGTVNEHCKNYHRISLDRSKSIPQPR